MPVVLDDFLEHWTIAGAAGPIASDVAGGRSLASSYGATPPRQASYRGRRGAEFRTSTFEATNPAYLASPGSDGLSALVYASSKINSFTLIGRVRPNKSGSTATKLVPIYGLYSATNKVNSSLYNQPVFLCTPASSGSTKLIVFVGGQVFDTAYATQEEGPASTEPLSDEGWNTVAVVIAGSASVNNQIDSVRVFTESPTGVRRAYLLGARKAGARIVWSGQPTDGQTVTIDGTVYTFKSSLSGTPATGTLTYVSGLPTAGKTLVVGDTTYTFVASLTASKSTAVIELNNAVPLEGSGSEASSKPEVAIQIGGFNFYISFVINGKFSGSAWTAGYVNGEKIGVLPQRLNDVLQGANTDPGIVKTPSRPSRTAPDYTGENNVDWKTGLRTWTVTDYVDDGGVKEITVEANDYGAYVIPIKVIDGWKGGGSGSSVGAPTTWRVRVKSGSVENGTGLLGGLYDTYNPVAGTTQGILYRGTSEAPSNAIVIQGTWAAMKALIIKAINGTADAGHNCSAANAVAAASDPGGNDILLTALLLGTAGNGKVVTTTTSSFTAPGTLTGGANGSDGGYVKIGSAAADSWGNLVKAVNDSGARGIDYGSATSAAHAVFSASAGDSYVQLLALTAGVAANGKSISTTTGATIKDEFGDITATQSAGGCAAGSWVVASGSRPDQTDLKAMVGGIPFAPAVTDSVFFGTHSDFGIYDGAMTFEYFGEYVYTPPPVSTRDAGWYRGAARAYYSAKSDYMPSWRSRNRLPQGLTSVRAPITLHGARVALKLWAVEAGRPFGVNRALITGRNLGGLGGTANVLADFRSMDRGLDRGQPKDGAAESALADANNVTFHNRLPRRRRGFRVICNADLGDDISPSAIFDATTASGEVYQLFFSRGSLYLFDNGNLTEIDTGWPTNEIPTVATVGEKTFICTTTRQRVFKAGTVYEPGVDAPTEAPSLESLEVATSPGGVVIVEPGWEYVVTYYDGTHETDSGPSPSLLVMVPDSERSNVTITLPISDSPTVTKRKVWKRKRGAPEGTYFLVGIVEDNTTLTYEDTADQPSTTPLDVFGGVAVTAEWPDITAVSEHDGRLVGYRGTDRQLIRYSEVGDGERWHPLNALRAKSEVVSSVSHEGRNYILTDTTVEVVDGEFVRGSSGALAVSRKTLDTSKGSFGPFSSDVGRGRLFWADANGLHVIGVGQDQQDVTTTISWPAHSYFANAIDTSGTSVVVRFNHVSQDLWVLMTQNNGEGGARNRIALVYNIDTKRWTPYDHSLSWVQRIKDGSLGRRFLGCDYLNNVIELDVYDGDGAQGNESWFPDGGKAIASISGKTINFSGTSLPTTLRGVSAVFEQVGDADDPFYRATILSSTATSITVDSVPSWLAAADLVHIGGIIGMIESAESDGGSPEPKHWKSAAIGFTNLVEADL